MLLLAGRRPLRGRLRRGKESWQGYLLLGQRKQIRSGDWVADKRTGKGVFYWTSGDRYEGDFVEGKFNGEGIYYWADGDRYEGEFSDGDFHGYGIKYHADGTRQAGRWEHDNFVG